MAYNVFYTSIPVLTTILDKDLSEKTMKQNPEINMHIAIKLLSLLPSYLYLSTLICDGLLL